MIISIENVDCQKI